MTNKQEQWEKSLNIDKRFGYLSQEARDHILAEIIFQRKQSRQEAVEEIENLLETQKKEFSHEEWIGYRYAIRDVIKSLSKENL